MSITIERRKDGLIEKRAKDGDHAQISALSGFLDTFLLDKEFASEAEVQAILDTWPAYAQENGVEIDPEFGQWATIDLGEDWLTIGHLGLGTPLYLAAVRSTAETQVEAESVQE